jgi:S-adenosylmethionine:tRNA ribosyltransferase-isomerase
MTFPLDFSIINPDDYTYNLPVENIASYPLVERDASRLLVVRKEGISEDVFHSLHHHLPGDSLMILNETRVVQARLKFRKSTGAAIEIFCLEPLRPAQEIYSAFSVSSPVVWRCLVGNAKKWKSGILHLPLSDGGELTANMLTSENDTRHIEFSWTPAEKSFGEVLELAGTTPLPPYIPREAESSDKERYQTVFARINGSVAAPTAGLHFSPNVFASLAEKNITTATLNLHVGAGTFKPLGGGALQKHEMHNEQLSISLETLKLLAGFEGKIISVGTTTVRTLETLYWFGVKLLADATSTFSLDQWEPYQLPQGIHRKTALAQVLNFCDRHHIETLCGNTRLMIVPGYRFGLSDILITNFHQPRSTLLLLVAAFAGNNWRNAYNYALEHHFRMLSYGDSCLFFPGE